MSPLELDDAAYRHGFDKEQAIYLIDHALGRRVLNSEPGSVTIAFAGHPHEGSTRRLELIARLTPARREVWVFHFFDLTDNFRDLWPDSEER
ncbi:MAG: hypothetical protein LBG11_10605 [Bifidobacteriaceae bacterium]|jgi:hypothetical protein|nr:hypothetical protein [Bifidobacteriaceae bacterium]